MNILLVGTCVVHAKLPELGNGEVIASDGDRVSIRFASGVRNFVFRVVAPHLTVTSEAPPLAKPARSARPARASKKKAVKAQP